MLENLINLKGGWLTFLYELLETLLRKQKTEKRNSKAVLLDFVTIDTLTSV